MAKINLTLEHEIVNGETVTFEAPCDCSAVDGLRVTYPTESGEETKEFCFRDAHNNDLTGLGNLFAEGAVVKAILRATTGCAYLLNADTNAHVEGTMTSLLASVGGKANIQVVSYVGIGKTGSYYPISVTFDFAPKVALMLGMTFSNGNVQWLPKFINNNPSQAVMLASLLTTSYQLNRGFVDASGSYGIYGKKSEDGKTFSWYCTSTDTNAGFNNANTTYYVLGIG